MENILGIVYYLTIVLIFQLPRLNIPYQIADYLATLGAAFTGALMASWFLDKIDSQRAAKRMFTMATSGWIIGGVLTTYFKTEEFHYVLGLFYLGGLFSLIIGKYLFSRAKKEINNVGDKFKI